MCDDGGQDSAQGAALLSGAGYTGVSQLQGGYAGYTQARACDARHGCLHMWGIKAYHL